MAESTRSTPTASNVIPSTVVPRYGLELCQNQHNFRSHSQGWRLHGLVGQAPCIFRGVRTRRWHQRRRLLLARNQFDRDRLTGHDPAGDALQSHPGSFQTGAYTDSFQNIQCYDTLKVNAILNQIDGKTHDGKSSAPVPVVFGMNFQSVSVGQKLIEKNVGSGGYLDAAGTPSALLVGEFQLVDAAIGEFVSELKKQGLLDSTLIVITAKHGQSPIDPNRFFPIPGHRGPERHVAG